MCRRRGYQKSVSDLRISWDHTSRRLSQLFTAKKPFLVTVPHLLSETCIGHITYPVVIFSIPQTMNQETIARSSQIADCEFSGRVSHQSLHFISSRLLAPNHWVPLPSCISSLFSPNAFSLLRFFLPQHLS